MKELTPETKLFLLNLFKGYKYNQPFNIEMKRGRFFCGTDAHKIILIPNQWNFQLGKPDFKLPDVESIMPVFNNDPMVLDMDKLLAVFKAIPVCNYEVTMECPSCDGAGKFDHYGETYDCRKCNESGILKTGRTESDKDREMLLKIDLTPFQVKYAHLLLRVFEHICNELPDSKCTILYSDSKQIWFGISDMIVMICGVLDPADKERNWKVQLFDNK